MKSLGPTRVNLFIPLVETLSERSEDGNRGSLQWSEWSSVFLDDLMSGRPLEQWSTFERDAQVLRHSSLVSVTVLLCTSHWGDVLPCVPLRLVATSPFPESLRGELSPTGLPS